MMVWNRGKKDRDTITISQRIAYSSLGLPSLPFPSSKHNFNTLKPYAIRICPHVVLCSVFLNKFLIPTKPFFSQNPSKLKKDQTDPLQFQDTRTKRHTTMATTTEKQAMVVGIDDSEHSTYALQWILDHFFAPFASNPPFKLVIVHAKPTASSAVGLAGPGAADVLPYVDADLRKIAARVVEKAKELCLSKLVHDAVVEVVEGDARNVLCDAVEKHHASILAVGSHGYGAIKRAVLGSVSDYCSHHAHCSVMIVKKPKIKH